MSGTKVSLELRKQLRSIATPIRKVKGAILFRVGRRGRGAFLIRSGQVRLTWDRNSNVYAALTLGPGTVIGLPATFSGEPYSLTAEVARECRLDFIPRRRLLNLVRQNSEAGFQIVRMLSQEIVLMRRAAKHAPSQARITTEGL